MPLEAYILDIIEDRRKAPGFTKLLTLVSLGFRSIVAIRNKLYDKKVCRSHAVDACVVSIGNIVSGGTGKTPLIQLLAGMLVKPEKVAILTRGYRSKIEKMGRSVEISTGLGSTVSPEECGDEAYWLANHTKVSVWVGPSKVKSAQFAVQKGSNILLVDDGMQHRRLKRNVEIVLLDGSDPWGKGAFLPRGLLRDSPKRLSKADLIIVSHVPKEKGLEALEKEIRNFTQSPIVHMERGFTIEGCENVDKVGLFCGIAKPAHFEAAVKGLGKTIVESLHRPDHKAPTVASLEAFARSCKEKGAKALVCTEKDFVKLPVLLNVELPIAVVKMKLEVKEGKDDWVKCIEKIERKGSSFSVSSRTNYDE